MTLPLLSFSMRARPAAASRSFGSISLGGLVELGRVFPAVERDGPRRLDEELVAVELDLRAGEGQRPVGLQHRRGVLVRGVAPLVEHQVQEEVIGLRSGQRRATGSARPCRPATSPLTFSDTVVAAGLASLPMHERRPVGPQRRQLGRVDLADLVAELRTSRPSRPARRARPSAG